MLTVGIYLEPKGPLGKSPGEELVLDLYTGSLNPLNLQGRGVDH